MESPRAGDESPLLSLPFDHYQRYHLTQRIVSLLWPRRKDNLLRILDVGGSSSSLKHFFPEDEVVLADIQGPPPFTYQEGVPFLYDAYFLAAGGQLPFADASFDIVTAHDTLEHVPNDLRPAFLEDLLRVARRLVILNGPVFHAETARAEQRLALFIGRTCLGENLSLKEHLVLGLPHKDLIESVVRNQGLGFITIPNGNLSLWLAMMAMKHYVLALPNPNRLHEVVDRTYNAVLSPQDFGGRCYREAYVIAKDERDAKTLRGVQAVFAPILEEPPVPGDAEALDAIVAALEEHAVEVRHVMETLQTTLAEVRDTLGQRDIALAEKDAALAERDTALMEANDLLTDKDAALAETEQALRLLQEQSQVAAGTIGFRLLERVRRVINRLAPPGTRRRNILALVRRGLDTILTQGWGRFIRRLIQVWRWAPRLFALNRPAQPEASLDDQYQLWLRAHALTRARIRSIRREATQLSYRPLVSIVMPTYNPDPRWLREAIESVRAQLYENWELCIADDCSSDPAVRAALEDYGKADQRIKVAYLEENRGISAASNRALALANGEFVGLLDHDDELKPDALFEVVRLLNRQPDLDFIYTDEDHRGPDGRLVQPFFKPDWSPDLLLSVNYVPHFAVYRKQLVDKLGGLRSECDLSQDYDLTLRVTERTDRIQHIPLPLYTWRTNPHSASAKLEAKLRAVKAAKRALSEAMQRRGLGAEILEGSIITTYRVRYRIQGQPLVSIIIPTRDRVDLLRRCIETVERKSTYANYEIVIVDNESSEEATLEYLRKSPYRCLAYPGPFRYAAMMNFAARETAGEHILFLNNDTQIIAPEWIEAMLEHSQRPEVAAVGARLLFPDGRAQHEGVIIGLAGGCAANVDHHGYFGLGELIHNCSAVTAACMMTRREVFEQLGGFDVNLGVAFNDVDYCLRAREQRYLIVYTPYADLYHYEGGTRGSGIPEHDERFFRKRWGNPGEYRDPYYNPNLDLRRPFNISLQR